MCYIHLGNIVIVNINMDTNVVSTHKEIHC